MKKLLNLFQDKKQHKKENSKALNNFLSIKGDIPKKPVEKQSSSRYSLQKLCVFNRTKLNSESYNSGRTRQTGESGQTEGKKAILVGLNYPRSHYQLNGCINDVKNGGKYLNGHGYETKILEDKDISRKYNIIEALNELKNSSQKTVFFHYSGHGTQQKDLNGDEKDGYDEVIFSKDKR